MKPTLLILAAGLGTRYGGLKQIDPVGPNGELIIDYSIHDALRAGFGKLVFVIRHSFEAAFREKLGHKFDAVAETACAYQELDALPASFSLPPDREKPWGTGHAILVAKDVIHEPFAVINADNYYGPRSFQIMAEFLKRARQASDSSQPDDYSMVGFVLRNTLSEHGHVARGICTVSGSGYLEKVVERTKIVKTDGGARCYDEDGNEILLSGDEIVSMNLWGFQTSIFRHLETQFEPFLRQRGADPKAEFFIPTVVDRLVAAGRARVNVLRTPDSWFGVTYREDRDIAAASIEKLIESGVYPRKLDHV